MVWVGGGFCFRGISFSLDYLSSLLTKASLLKTFRLTDEGSLNDRKKLALDVGMLHPNGDHSPRVADFR